MDEASAQTNVSHAPSGLGRMVRPLWVRDFRLLFTG